MSAQGKGARNRVVVIPGQTFFALQTYLASRNQGCIVEALDQAPLLAGALDPMGPNGDQVLYVMVQGRILRGVAATSLPHEYSKLAGAKPIGCAIPLVHEPWRGRFR